MVEWCSARNRDCQQTVAQPVAQPVADGHSFPACKSHAMTRFSQQGSLSHAGTQFVRVFARVPRLCACWWCWLRPRKCNAPALNATVLLCLPSPTPPNAVTSNTPSCTPALSLENTAGANVAMSSTTGGLTGRECILPTATVRDVVFGKRPNMQPTVDQSLGLTFYLVFIEKNALFLSFF